ncbi:MAG: hypothetical protein ACMXYF_00005 [Candidatus Woesearchaeota archaeon]
MSIGPGGVVDKGLQPLPLPIGMLWALLEPSGYIGLLGLLVVLFLINRYFHTWKKKLFFSLVCIFLFILYLIEMAPTHMATFI